MFEDWETRGLLVKSTWFSAWSCVPAINDTTFGDYGEEGLREEEARGQVSPTCRQLGRHFLCGLRN